MKITKCLVACDLNPTYLEFYPLVRKYWKNIVGIDTILILIADEIPYDLKEFSDEIILFKPVENIHTAFQAQCIRILYPSIIGSNENIIISDMDLIPLNKKYYIENDMAEDITLQKSYNISSEDIIDINNIIKDIK